ncbi:sigma factor-like helix-turn-helix DNA-binding protein [Kitasatospora sp. NPDC058218]|uniref:sigma factor-like helix-turn-helix DNA-binding protein n=1 Tax=Kitasatospora sp. NPDC058218 TaxID=3346385 RepID=UPI0036DA91D9
MSGSDAATAPQAADWITNCWEIHDERSREMSIRRAQGQTLSEIGAAYGLSRERVRQVIQAQEQAWETWADMFQGDWREDVLRRFVDSPLVAEQALAEVLVDPRGVVRRALLGRLGLKEPQTWSGRIAGIWAADETSLDTLLRELVAQAPIRAEELEERAAALGIPDVVPIEDILTDRRSPLVRGTGGHWLRRSAKGRDAAYLWLEQVGEARRVEDINEGIGGAGPRALGEALRRDERFRQIRPEGTWVIADWPLAQASTHTNALDVMVQVLRTSGPLGRRELFARVMKEYPVGYARLQQCLISDQIGRLPGGLLGLVEDGAEPLEASEPTRPPTMVVDESGQVIGIRLLVDKDVLRGSGIVVNSWLTWYLGLRRAPMSRTFALADGSGHLVIRRGTSAAQMSSLRAQAQSQGMVQGCQLVVLIRLDEESAVIRHACQAGSCPAVAGG